MASEPISHCQLVDFMNRSLELMKQVVGKVRAQPEDPADEETLRSYQLYIAMLQDYKDYDYYMKRDRWDWIWKSEPGYSYKDLYYRLSWINREIVCIL